MRHAPHRSRAFSGFTLMELMIVMLIIGILLAFILAAATNAVRAAEERATQALISKLDTGLADRLEALLTQRVEPTDIHRANAYVTNPARKTYTATDRDMFQRAAILARYDQLKAELPDVFVVKVDPSALAANSVPTNYPISYGHVPFTAFTTDPDYSCVVPIGTGIPANFAVGTGIHGASYTVHASINKNLGKFTDPTSGQTGAGYATKMFDGVDSNGDSLIDNIAENGAVDASVPLALLNHQHVTARSEMLYALLVEGQGPYGSVFNRDDFTEKEVKDTDQDGLPEFVDAWGKPLQFYRWPILYHSDVQRGLSLQQTGSADVNGNPAYGCKDVNGNVMVAAMPYHGPFDNREQDPLDPNQEVVMPDWWSASSNVQNVYGYTAQNGLSGSGVFFQTYFHQLVEPLAGSAGLGSAPGASQYYWDRSNPNVSPVPLYPRRAFYSRFLIISGGPDGQPGVPYLTDKRFSGSTPMFTDSALKTQAASNIGTATPFLMIESQAAQATLARSGAPFFTPNNITNAAGDPYTNQLQLDGLDDITNHNLSSTASPAQ